MYNDGNDECPVPMLQIHASMSHARSFCCSYSRHHHGPDSGDRGIAAAFIRYLNAKKCKYASAELVLFLISFTGMC